MTNGNALRIEVMNAGHIGFCMSSYVEDKCFDCPSERECIFLYVTEKGENTNEQNKKNM